MSNIDVTLLQREMQKLKAERDQRSGDKGGGGDHTGGQPPGGDQLEKRVEKLESTMIDVQLRLVRIEARLESMATKADIETVNTKIQEMGRTMIQWAVGSAVGMSALFATIAFSLARALS